MNKTARVIITFDCNRNCDYCCNKYAHIVNKGISLTSLEPLLNYDIVCITGGEPMLYPDRIIKIASYLKKHEASIIIYLYSALYRPTPIAHKAINLMDGVHFTLHEASSELDIANFRFFQNDIPWYRNKSFRLYVHPGISINVPIKPILWKRIEIKNWIGEDTCELPKGETLFILNKKTLINSKYGYKSKE